MSKRAFTLILPYYENPGQLERQLRRICDLGKGVAENVHLIVCDDGSPNVRAAPVAADFKFKMKALASFQLFRIDVDVRWNWLACRNIGAHYALSEWLLMTDIDHELPVQTARRIIEKKLRAENVYRFRRRDAPNLTPYKEHPNSWLMSKAMFRTVGGYDERFSGFYGTDGEFRDRVRANAARIVMLEEFLIRVPREVVPDASTVTYGRKEKQDGEGVARIRAKIAKEGGKPTRLTFPYHKVFEVRP